MDVQYFIDKFEAIPEEQWTIRCYQDAQNRRCALGHCSPNILNKHRGKRVESFLDIIDLHEKDSLDLISLFVDYGYCVPTVNDGHCGDYKQATPKQRILAALRDIQKKVEREDASGIPLCSGCGKAITECECEDEEEEVDEDWGAGAAEEVDHKLVELI